MHVSHPCHFVTSYYISALKITIGSSVSVRSSRYEARGKFGEHERCVRVARAVAESNSTFLSALQLQLFHNIFNLKENFFLEGFVC